MSQPYKGDTNTLTQVKLPSAIEQVQWASLMAAPGASVALHVFTRYVGSGAEVEAKLTDQAGRTHGTIKGMLSANRFTAVIPVPATAEQALFAEVKLPKHGLSLTSGALLLTPPVKIEQATWDKQEARRGDVLKLTANVKGVPDGTEAKIVIFEHDGDGAHDLVTAVPVLVRGGKIETEWAFEYVEDTDDIPRDEEVERSYQAPEYFFRVNVNGVLADSGLLQFKDWIDVVLTDDDGEPIPNEPYIFHMPDGTQRKGQLDAEGKAREEDIPPGPFYVEFPELEEADESETED